MSLRRPVAIALLAALLVCPFAFGAAATPNPPTSVCVNSKCVTTASAGAGVKWHPGHYAASDNNTNPGNGKASAKAAEIALLRASPPNVLGIEEAYAWGDLESNSSSCSAGQGSYCFTDLDSDYKAITGYTSGSTTTATYSAPRRMVIAIYTGIEGTTDATDDDVIPNYVLTGSSYGLGPDGSHNGYGLQDGGQGFTAAIWNTNVNARLQALGTALASHVLPDGYTVDTSPYIEAIMSLDETASWNNNSGDGASNGGALSGAQSMLSAWVAAFPHTSVASNNNYGFGSQASTAAFEQWMAGARVAASAPDVYGNSSCFCVNDAGESGISWGEASYAGFTYTGNNSSNPPSGWYQQYSAAGSGTNMQGTIAGMFNVQQPDMVNDSFSPADVFTQGSTNLHATHLFWTMLSGFSPNSANWLGSAGAIGSWSSGSSGGVMATIVSSPIANTACPTSYSSCNTN
jgi:hypothetical protein